MPNHVINQITGPSVPEIAALLRGEGGEEIDFSKLVPMPPILRHTVSGSKPFNGVAHHVWFVENPDADYPARIERPLTVEERAEIKALGCESWYDWSIKNWGTKWGAYRSSVTADKIRFETAWNFPEPIMNALIDRLPMGDFVWQYADEDYGHNIGMWMYYEGELLGDEISEEKARHWAMKLWEMSDEEIAERDAERDECDKADQEAERKFRV